MTTYTAIAGQSIFDVCLNTYGKLDFLYKLIQDNSFGNINTVVLSGQVFVWDDSLVIDQAINNKFSATGIRYATDIGISGSVYYVTNSTGQPATIPSVSGVPPVASKKYQVVYNTSFTSGANGTTVITPLDINGGSLAGYDILQIELEIKPLLASQFVWNKSAGVLTLIAGTAVDAGQTLFILYSQIITS